MACEQSRHRSSLSAETDYLGPSGERPVWRASRTSRLCRRATMSIFVPPASSCNPITTPMKKRAKTLRRYWTIACQACALKSKCTTARGEARGSRDGSIEAVLEAVQARLDRQPRTRCASAARLSEHPFGTIKVLDGSHALPDENPQKCEHRNGAPRPGLQHEKSDPHSGRWRLDGGDPGISSPHRR